MASTAGVPDNVGSCSAEPADPATVVYLPKAKVRRAEDSRTAPASLVGQPATVALSSPPFVGRPTPEAVLSLVGAARGAAAPKARGRSSSNHGIAATLYGILAAGVLADAWESPPRN